MGVPQLFRMVASSEHCLIGGMPAFKLTLGRSPMPKTPTESLFYKQIRYTVDNLVSMDAVQRFQIVIFPAQRQAARRANEGVIAFDKRKSSVRFTGWRLVLCRFYG